MVSNYSESKALYGLRWVEGESGTTYLCNEKALERLERPTEKQLQTLCVDESGNPQNE